MTLLTTMLDFTDTGEIGLLVTEDGVASNGGGDRQGRPAEGQRTGAGLRLAAGQRPDLAVRRQGLPEGPGAAGVRPALLEQRRHQPARPDVLLVRPQHLPGEQAARARAPPRSCGAPVDLGRIDVPTFLYASKEDHIVPWKTAYASTQTAVRGHHVRARRQRPHRRGDQPAGEDEAQLLGRHRWRRPARGRRRLVRRRGKSPRQLVADLERVARRARRRRSTRPKRLGNDEFAPIEDAPGSYVKEKAS